MPLDDLQRAVGRVLKEWRLRKGYSQGAFIIRADLNITQSAFSRIESGESAATLGQLAACCDVLKVSVAQLVGEAEQRERFFL